MGGFSRKFRCWQCTLASVQHLNGLLVFRAIIILFIRFYVLSFGRALLKVGFYPRYVALNLGFSLSIPYWLHTGSNEIWSPDGAPSGQLCDCNIPVELYNITLLCKVEISQSSASNYNKQEGSLEFFF